MTNPNSENTNEGHSLDRLVGRLGWLKTKGENVRVKIIAVNHDKPCHKCGGPWGTVETQGHAMVGSGMMSLAGTTAEGCLNDVKLDDDTAGTPNYIGADGARGVSPLDLGAAEMLPHRKALA